MWSHLLNEVNQRRQLRRLQPPLPSELSRVPSPILVVGFDAQETAEIVRGLELLGHDVRPAICASAILPLIRRCLPAAAVAAAELEFAGEPLLARLSGLPSLKRLIATGPAGNGPLEILARSCRADVYLPRPVDAEALAAALQGIVGGVEEGAILYATGAEVASLAHHSRDRPMMN